MKDTIPLSYLRIWCRRHDAWLSFKTLEQERYLVNPQGYFVELPEGSLQSLSPRTTFPLEHRFSSVDLDTLAVREQFGSDAKFISVPLSVVKRQDPVRVPLTELLEDPLTSVPWAATIPSMERYVLVRAIENGLVQWSDIERLGQERQGNGTVGELLVHGGMTMWEPLLAYCLDLRPASRLDPPSLRVMIERREWELTGEILLAMRKISRTQLEHGLKIKREGSQALGQILTAMGACKQQDIDECLEIQGLLKEVQGNEVALIGSLLVNQGIISQDDLEEVLRNQRVARQPLSRILVSMGACQQRDIDGYANAFGGQSFQQEVDEANLSNYLMKTETITKIQLNEALRVQQRGRQVLGEMLVAMGLCTAADIETVLALQKEVREHYRSGIQKLGALLIARGKVPPAKVEEAVELQSIGRQPFGAILVALNACSADDVRQALEIQAKWRAKTRPAGDRLGEVLVKNKVLTPDQLEEPLMEHLREEKPLGRILVERRICTPEQIIDALIVRDHARQIEFLKFVRQFMPPSVDNVKQRAAPNQRAAAGRDSLMGKLTSWLVKKDEKEK